MRTIVEPDEETIERLRSEAVDRRPIVMVNLLRYRDRAEYPDGEGEPCAGREAYRRYARGVVPLLLEVGGRPLWQGRVRATFIAPGGERWDEVVLVHYPSREAFVRMVSSEAYARVRAHRAAALADSRLIETRPSFLPSTLLRALGLAARAKAIVRPGVRPAPV